LSFQIGYLSPQRFNDVAEFHRFIWRIPSCLEYLIMVRNSKLKISRYIQCPDAADRHSAWVVIAEIKCKAIVLVMN